MCLCFFSTDAISGLEELYRRHPTLITASLGQVVNGILKLLIDDVSLCGWPRIG